MASFVRSGHVIAVLASSAGMIAACSLDPWGEAIFETSGGTTSSSSGGGDGGGATTTTTTTTTTTGGGAGGQGGGAGQGGAMGTGGAGGMAMGGGGPGGAGGAGGGPVSVCGDGMVDVAMGEHCDDMNTDSGDGCSNDCTYELSDGCPTVALSLGTTLLTFDGNTVPANPTSGSSCGGNSSGDYIFRIQPVVGGTLQATITAPLYSELLWLSSTCPINPPQTEIACDDMYPVVLSVPVQAGATYYLGVDGNGGQEGPFSLTLVVMP